MENLSGKEMDYSVAKKRVRQLKKFYVNLLIFIIVFAIYAGRKYYKTGEFTFLEFNNWSAVFWVWGIILVLKAVKLFFFNQDWKKKMMDKQLNK